MRSAQKTILFVTIVFFGLVAGVKCNPLAKLLDAGPFTGHVVDADSGKPIAGAFVGFTWDGAGWIEGHSRLLTILVQTDAEGTYRVPWQGDALDATDKHSIHWSESVWAQGYLLSQTADGTQVAEGAHIVLKRASSALDALAPAHRLNPTSYCCKEDTRWDTKNEARDARRASNRPARQALALALYRDAFHWVCEDTVPDGALTASIVEQPRGNLASYLQDYDTTAYQSRVGGTLKDEWQAFDRKTGFDTSMTNATLDRALLPDLCRLSRYAPALSGAAP